MSKVPRNDLAPGSGGEGAEVVAIEALRNETCPSPKRKFTPPEWWL